MKYLLIPIIALCGCATKPTPSKPAIDAGRAVGSSVSAASMTLSDVEKLLDQAIEINKSTPR